MIKKRKKLQFLFFTLEQCPCWNCVIHFFFLSCLLDENVSLYSFECFITCFWCPNGFNLNEHEKRACSTLIYSSNTGECFILLFSDTLFLQRRDVFCDFQRRLYAAQAARKVDAAAAVEPVKLLPQEVQVSR